MHSALSDEQRRRANARSYANVYQRRELLSQKRCEYCGSHESQKHHDDYSRPLQVRWLCADCHQALHADLIPSLEPVPA